MDERFRPWEVLATREIYSARPWVALAVQDVRLPGGQIVDGYHKVTFADYVVVFAQRRDGRVVVERLYKHGVGNQTIALPSGLMEDGEDPLATAKRELMEETGYESDDWSRLGSFVLNGNYGCGKANLFLARNARRVAEPDSGDLEEMEITTMAVDELVRGTQTGDIVLIGTVAAIAIATNPAFSHDGATVGDNAG